MKILKTWSKEAILSWIKIYKILLDRISFLSAAIDEGY